MVDIVITCQWFALCDREAVVTVAHPVLGDVPVCARCLAKIEAITGGQR